MATTFIMGTPKLKEGNTWDAICNNALGAHFANGSGCELRADKTSFKSSTVSLLLNLNDVMAKNDQNLEGILKKVEKQRREIDPSWKIKIGSEDGGKDVDKYVKEFQWKDRMFTRAKGLPEIIALIQEQVNRCDAAIKKQMADYQDLKSQLNALLKKQEGGLLTRDLNEIFDEYKVNLEDMKSRHLTYLIAVVNKNQVTNWLSKYEYLDDRVVPRSSRYLDVCDKDGNQLWSVVVFKSNQDTFMNAAKGKLKVYVRTYDPGQMGYVEEKKKRYELSEKIKTLEADLKKNSEAVFSDLFECYMHVKVLRIHIECVLRWGVGSSYCLCVIKPVSGKEKKLTKSLISIFSDTKDEKGLYGTKEELGDAEDYFPFIMIPFNVGMN